MANSKPSQPGRVVLIAIVLLLLVLLCFYIFQKNRHDVPPSGTAPKPASRESASAPAAEGIELPAQAPGIALVQHQGYSLGFNADAHQASWVAYLLTAAEVRSANRPRTNNFRPDPQVPASATDADYDGSGYDRGHLAPAEDQSYSAATMSESFFYSNMSPQVPAFNRGVWRRLEELVRFWASSYDSVFIVTGPVLTGGLPRIGPHGVAVPQKYYKAVLVYGKNGVQAVGFLLNNEASSATLKSFALPVDEVERATGLDLFPQLPDDVEQRIEASVVLENWKWTRRK